MSVTLHDSDEAVYGNFFCQSPLAAPMRLLLKRSGQGDRAVPLETLGPWPVGSRL